MVSIRQKFKKKAPPRVELVVVAMIAIVVLAGAGLWAWTAQKSWKGVMLERQVNKGRQVSPETLVMVWEQIRDLDNTFLPGTHVHLPGMVAHLMAMEVRLPIDKRTDAVVAGEASIKNALAREPANTHAWARLAWFRQLQEGPSPEVVEALRMSIYTAPARKSLLFWRIQTAGVNREYWDDEFENMIRRQVRYAWRVSPKRLEGIVAGTDMASFID